VARPDRRVAANRLALRPYRTMTTPDSGTLAVYDSARRRWRALEEARALWTYRSLVYELVIRDIKVRYKRSILGVIWTMLAPLLNMIALTLVFSTILKQDIKNYPVYFMAGSVLWTYFSQTTSAAASLTQDSNEIAKRIYIPRSVFVASAVGVGLVNLALSIVPLVLILLVTGYPLYLTWLFLPISVAIVTLFAAGLGFLLYTLASRFTDVREMYLVFVQTWFFLTPIVYPTSIVPEKFRIALWINPMYYLLQTFRKPIYDGALPSLPLIGGSLALAAGACLVGWIYFCRRADEFAFLT
jgi:homopolymeric O-antigen transport system permease protein